MLSLWFKSNLLQVVSLILVGLAVWMLTDPTFYISLAQDENNYTISLYIFLIAGFLLLLASFFGCCGSLKESHCMLVSVRTWVVNVLPPSITLAFQFFCVMLIIIVAEISAGIWAYSNSESLEAVVRRTVKNTVHEEYYQNEQRKSTFDAIQKGVRFLLSNSSKCFKWLLLYFSCNAVDLTIRPTGTEART